MNRLQDHLDIVGDELIHKIYQKSSKLYNKHIAHVNSTWLGGGVAEILWSLVPLMNDIGLEAGWRILYGNPDFFNITKKFHNALQGDSINLTQIKKNIYLQTNQHFAQITHLDHDLLVIHDPQPLPLLNFYHKVQPWIWRCHIDLSHPNEQLWKFLKRYILKYDLVIVSHEQYKKADLPVEQRIIHPAIDPLTPKNKPLKDADIKKYLQKFKIPTDKPIITQISRFDKWKDPEGVIDVYLKVREKFDCRLVMCGSMAADDPEGFEIFEKVKKKAGRYIATGDIIFITVENQILVNVLQRVSKVIIQKSLREGFGLTVTEALWKGTPVVASNIGGIPLQIIDGKNGYLLEPEDTDGFANKILDILKNPDEANKLGIEAKEFVRQNFLMTRLLLDYLNLFEELLGKK